MFLHHKRSCELPIAAGKIGQHPNNKKDNALTILPKALVSEINKSAASIKGPVCLADRIESLDVLRGFALLGILLVNIEDFAGIEGLHGFPVGLTKAAFIGWHHHLDHLIVNFVWLFAEGKMRGLFAMLFGAGAILLTERLERQSKGRPATIVYYRRNACLLLFGLCHGFLIWSGDVLFEYAAVALLVLFPLRRLSSRTLIVAGLLVWVVGSGAVHVFAARALLRKTAALSQAQEAGLAVSPQQRTFLRFSQKDKVIEIETSVRTMQAERSGYLKGWANNAREESAFLVLIFGKLWFLEVLGAMLTGMGLYKSGFLTNQRPVREYVLIIGACYGLSSSIVLVGLSQLSHSLFSPAVDAFWIREPYSIQVACGTLANTSLLLLVIRYRVAPWVTKSLSAVGRTALSNYVLSSVLCKAIFSWGPWPLFAKLEFYQWYLVVAAVWTLLLVTSCSWVRVFAYGPLEWIWRSLTYWKLQRILLAPKPPLAATVTD